MRAASVFRELAQRRQLATWLIASAVGCFVFYRIGYVRTLDPQNLQWMWHEDPFTHTMGWEQFRNAPLLQYPITRNELYGLEWSSTIVFTDSIPIVALVLRPFSALLPVPFQYLGWWCLLSLVLQAYFGAKLVELRSPKLGHMAIGAAFFATTPILIERLGLQTGVGSHWLLLWAIWLYFAARGPAHRHWLVLLALAVSIHAYLFVMVGAIWIAQLASTWMQRALSRRDLVLAGGSLVGLVAWMHVLGYFLVGGGAAAGSWRSNFDLLDFLAPAHGSRFGLIKHQYNEPWDGCSYLGAGMIALVVVGGAIAIVRRRQLEPPSASAPRWLPLVVVLVGLAAFAMTNRITLRRQVVLDLPLPDLLRGLYETFRGATRMIWPAYYAIFVGGIWLALRAWPRRATWLLGGALLLQLVDLRDIGKLKRREVRGYGIVRGLQDPVWPVIAERYRNIVSVPAHHRQYDWPTFAWFAARSGLGSNIGYLSRSNPAIRDAGTRRYLDAVATGSFAADTVYYFPSAILWNVGRNAMGPDDVALVADGYHLIVPRGRSWIAPREQPPLVAVPSLGEPIWFNNRDAGGLLVENWSWPEAWGTWSIDNVSDLVLPVPPNERVRVTFQYRLLHGPAPQRLRVTLAGQAFDVQPVRTGINRAATFEVQTPKRLLDVRFEVALVDKIPNVRPLGIGLISAQVTRVSEPVDSVPKAAQTAPILDQPISFAEGGMGRGLLGLGWSWGESWGTWSEDDVTHMVLPVPPNQPLELVFRWIAHSAAGDSQRVKVVVDEQPFDATILADGTAHDSRFAIASQRPWIRVRVEVAAPLQAKDGRLLGVGLQTVTVRRR